MAKQKKYNEPTIDELNKYVAGELLPKEQHQIEKSALQNQQIEDTLEGLEQLKNASIDQQAVSDELRQRLQKRVETKERKLLPFYYASAAAVVLAVGLSWWMVREQEVPTTVSAPVTKEKAKPMSETAKQTAIVSAPEKEITKTSRIASTQLVVKARKKRQESVIALAQEVPAADLAIESSKTEELQVAPLPVAVSTPQPVGTIAKIASENTRVARVEALKASAPTLSDETLFALRGQVLDAIDQKALVGRSVALIGQTQAVLTDSNGNFILRNVRKNSQLTVNSTGYQPAQITIKDSTISPILMLEDKQVLSEVVIVDYGKTANVSQKLAPKSGWKAYNDYLKTSAQTFITNNPQVPRGRVALGFTVNTAGELMNFENKNKANPLLFEEAVRIVKEREKWAVSYKKGKLQAEKIRLVISFE